MGSHRSKQKTGKQRKRRASAPLAEEFSSPVTIAAQQRLLSSAIQRFQADPDSLSPHDIINLQRVIGNQALTNLLSQNGLSPRSGGAHPIQRWPWSKKKKKAEISGPFNVTRNGEAFDKSKVKEGLGYSQDPMDVQPELSFEDLKRRAKEARSTSDPLIKAQFLKYFSEHYAPHLTGEIEYFQFMAQKLAYMDLSTGDEIGTNIDTTSGQGSFIDQMLPDNEKQTDKDSRYASSYKVERTYHNEAGLNCFLLLPSDKDTRMNAIVLFRGTGKNTMGAKRGEASGALADTDYGGVGRTAFAKASLVMEEWVKVASQYNRITISGHSLGGAMAERFYVLASKAAPGKLRLITFQGAAIDRIGTVGDVMGEKDPQKQGAKVTRVVARGDIVPLGGMAHVPGQKLKYSPRGGGKYNPLEAHLQIDLVKQQLNAALDKSIGPVESDVSGVVVHDKKGGTNFTKTALTAGKHLATVIGHTIYALTGYGLYDMIKSGVVKGKESRL